MSQLQREDERRDRSALSVDVGEFGGGQQVPSIQPEVEVKDGGHGIYISFAFLGSGFLFPFFGIAAAVSYFEAVFAPLLPPDNATLYNYTPTLTENIEFYFSAAYNLGAIITFFPIIRSSARYPVRARLLLGFVTQLVIVALVPVLVEIVDATAPAVTGLIVLFSFLLLLLFVLGGTSGLLASSLFGLASVFPPKYIQSVQLGGGAAAFVMALLRALTLAVIPPAESGAAKISGALYFSLTAVIILLCIVCILLLRRSPFFSHHAAHLSVSFAGGEKKTKTSFDQLATPMKRGKGGKDGDKDAASPLISAATPSSSRTQPVPSTSPSPSLPFTQRMGWKAFVVSLEPTSQIFLTYALMALLYPGVIFDIPPNGYTNVEKAKAEMDKADATAFSWYQFSLISVWSVFQFLGRIPPISRRLCSFFTPRRMWAAVVLPLAAFTALLVAFASEQVRTESAFFNNAIWLVYIAAAIVSMMGVAGATFAIVAAPQTASRLALSSNQGGTNKHGPREREAENPFSSPTSHFAGSNSEERDVEYASRTHRASSVLPDQPYSSRQEMRSVQSMSDAGWRESGREREGQRQGGGGKEKEATSPTEMVGIFVSFALNLGLVVGAYVAIFVGQPLQPAR